MTRAAAALAAGLAAVAIALVVTLSGSPLVLAHSNGTLADSKIAESTGNAEACQAGETLPAGTSAIRLSLWSTAGPRLRVTALSGTSVATEGVIDAGWTTGVVTVPVKSVARASSHVRICIKLGQTPENVLFVGSQTAAAVAARTGKGEALPGRIKIEYLRVAHSSWWSHVRMIARRMGLGRAPTGAWIALLVIALMGAVVASVSWLSLKELR
jgi:hypothetical protein